MTAIRFGTYIIPSTSVFYESLCCYGIVSYLPLVSGHVIVFSKKNVKSMEELSKLEVNDVITSLQTISNVLAFEENYIRVDITMHDVGESTITKKVHPHIHFHLLPRAHGDYRSNDDMKEDMRQFHVYESSKEYINYAQQRRIAFKLRELFPGNQPSQEDFLPGARPESSLNILKNIIGGTETIISHTLPQLLGQACSVEIIEALVNTRIQLIGQMFFVLDKTMNADDISSLQAELVVLQGYDRLAAFTIVANQHNKSWRNKNLNSDGYIEVDMVR